MRETRLVLVFLALLGVSVTGCSTVSPIASIDKGDQPARTTHLAGDSTVMTYPASTIQEGWGQELEPFFIDKVTINNQAIGGANVRSFKNGRWSNILSALKAGDYVLIQFGANDSGTAHGPVTPADFAATLGQMVEEVRLKWPSSWSRNCSASTARWRPISNRPSVRVWRNVGDIERLPVMSQDQRVKAAGV